MRVVAHGIRTDHLSVSYIPRTDESEQARARELESALEDQVEQAGAMERRIEDEKSRALASEEKLLESQTQVRRLQVHILKKKSTFYRECLQEVVLGH